MEVVVDDTQLSLAIGKKGQNVRLAAKLLGWRIDIKSEEEKRQEVESRMAELVVPGAPVSVLLDHGLTEELAEALLTAGITTVEKLGAMTPEQLEGLAGIGPDAVQPIQQAVMNYYGQFEGSVEGEAAAEAAIETAAVENAALESDEAKNAPAENAAVETSAAPREAAGEEEGSVEEPQKQSVTIDSGEASPAE